jgi:NAD(P)-dependent dehydrogenase (short-subunit alcohol dehydrogenase family)
MKTTVLITGATGVIGKATARELAKHNCQLILVARSLEKLSAVKSGIESTSGNSDIDLVVADLSEPKSVKQAVQEIKKRYSSLNALINVAAIFKPTRLENSSGLEYMFATNHLGPFILTTGLLDLLKAGKPSGVLTVTAPSTTKVNFEDLQGTKKFSAGFMGVFGATKMMNLMFTYALARRLEGSGVTANAFHPGLVKSRLTREMPAVLNSLIQMLSKPPDRAARKLSSFITEKTYAGSHGLFYKFDGKEMKSSSYSHNMELQDKLWSVSESLANQAG